MRKIAKVYRIECAQRLAPRRPGSAYSAGRVCRGGRAGGLRLLMLLAPTRTVPSRYFGDASSRIAQRDALANRIVMPRNGRASEPQPLETLLELSGAARMRAGVSGTAMHAANSPMPTSDHERHRGAETAPRMV